MAFFMYFIDVIRGKNITFVYHKILYNMKEEELIEQMKNGNNIALWYIFFIFVFLTSQIKIAIAIPTTILTRINAILYSNVFLVIIQASFDENKNLKLSSPAHGLAKIPFEKFNFLKASIIPVIGR